MLNVSTTQEYMAVRTSTEPSIAMVVDRLMENGWSVEMIQQHMGDIREAIEESYVI